MILINFKNVLEKTINNKFKISCHIKISNKDLNTNKIY